MLGTLATLHSCLVHNLCCTKQASPGATHSGRPITASTPANAANVRAICARDAAKDLELPHSPVSSKRRNVLGLPSTTWQRLAKQEKLHPYKLVRSQRLMPQDFQRRLNMCNFLVTLTPDDISNILFSDEAQFHLDGTVNTQNVRRYAPRKGM